MSVSTVQAPPLTSGMPRVNLMPPEIAEAARFRQVQVGLGAAIAAAVGIVALLYLNAHSGVSSAKSELAQQQAQQTELQSKLASLASVQAAFDEVQSKQALLAQAMSNEVRWSFFLNDLSLRMPSNVWLTSMNVTETPGSVAPPAAPATLGTAAPAVAAAVPIGTVTFTAVGFTHDDVATWLEAMTKVKGFQDPTFNNSTETQLGTRNVVNFSGSVTMNSIALSRRYTAPLTSAAATTTQPGVTP